MLAQLKEYLPFLNLLILVIVIIVISTRKSTESFGVLSDGTNLLTSDGTGNLSTTTGTNVLSDVNAKINNLTNKITQNENDLKNVYTKTDTNNQIKQLGGYTELYTTSGVSGYCKNTDLSGYIYDYEGAVKKCSSIPQCTGITCNKRGSDVVCKTKTGDLMPGYVTGQTNYNCYARKTTV